MDLEKNARIYAGIPEDSPQDLKYCVMDKKAKYDAFIAGANWQKEQKPDEWNEEVDLNKEIDNYFDNYKLAKKEECWLNLDQAHLFAKHFFELGVNASNPLTCEDIEQYARNEADKFASKEYEYYNDIGLLKKGFYWGCKAGANWQEQQIKNRAIWCEAHPEDGEIWGCFDIYNLRDGEKVKVIVIKEE